MGDTPIILLIQIGASTCSKYFMHFNKNWFLYFLREFCFLVSRYDFDFYSKFQLSFTRGIFLLLEKAQIYFCCLIDLWNLTLAALAIRWKLKQLWYCLQADSVNLFKYSMLPSRIFPILMTLNALWVSNPRIITPVTPLPLRIIAWL